MRTVTIFLVLLVLLTLSGCAALEPLIPQPEYEVRSEETLPPSTRPTYNLTGYPAATREGYIDGCETAKRTRYGQKDEARYASDGQYQMGWNDGFDLCQPR